MTTTRTLAPAKINLFLHVGGLAPDGYHPLKSWMAFADVGDTLSLSEADRPSFRVTGEFSGGMEGADNLVVRARDRILEAMGISDFPCALHLEKRLPVASGMGGGSSDAAACLRLVGKAVGAPEALLHTLAAGLGADVPACLRAASLIAEGRGERLSAAPSIPPLPCVLVNPGVAVSTREVFLAFDAGTAGDLGKIGAPAGFDTPHEVAVFLARQRNDLAASAIAAQPVIGEALDLLKNAPEALLARMTGSGATVFALCADTASAERLAQQTVGIRPNWWVRACQLS